MNAEGALRSLMRRDASRWRVKAVPGFASPRAVLALWDDGLDTRAIATVLLAREAAVAATLARALAERRAA